MYCCPLYRYYYCSRLLALSQLQFDRAWNQLLGAAAHVMAMESTGQSFSRFQGELKGWVFAAFTKCKLLCCLRVLQYEVSVTNLGLLIVYVSTFTIQPAVSCLRCFMRLSVQVHSVQRHWCCGLGRQMESPGTLSHVPW